MIMHYFYHQLAEHLYNHFSSQNIAPEFGFCEQLKSFAMLRFHLNFDSNQGKYHFHLNNSFVRRDL